MLLKESRQAASEKPPKVETPKLEQSIIIEAPVEKPKEEPKEVKEDVTDFKNIMRAFNFLKDALSASSELKGATQEHMHTMLQKSTEVNEQVIRHCHIWGRLAPGESFTRVSAEVEELIKAKL